MSEVVKTNVPQTVLLQQLAEIGGNASGVEDIAHGIHKNIAVILFAVAISAYAPIFLSLRSFAALKTADPQSLKTRSCLSAVKIGTMTRMKQSRPRRTSPTVE